jgi:hypothetical protein
MLKDAICFVLFIALPFFAICLPIFVEFQSIWHEVTKDTPPHGSTTRQGGRNWPAAPQPGGNAHQRRKQRRKKLAAV